MKAVVALIRKDWHQVRWFALGGLAVFCALPVLVVIKDPGFVGDLSETLNLGLGGLFAILVGTGIVCADFQSSLAGFWGSRPVRPALWVVTKFMTGLLCVKGITAAGLILAMLLRGSVSAHPTQMEYLWALLTCHTWTIALLYSVAFLIACLVRQATRAVLLSLAAGLVVYFVPVLVPQLEQVSVLNLLDRGSSPLRLETVDLMEKPQFAGHGRESWGYWFGSPHWVSLPMGRSRVLVFHYFPGYGTFAAAMLAGIVSLAVAARVVVKKDVRVQAGQKQLVWALGAMVLLLFACTAFSLRSNLRMLRPMPQPYDIGRRQNLVTTSDGDSRGMILVQDPDSKSQTRLLCRYAAAGRDEITFEQSVVDPPASIQGYVGAQGLAWSRNRPDLVWLLVFSPTTSGSDRKTVGRLVTCHLDKASQKASVISQLDLAVHVSRDSSMPGGSALVYCRDRLYANAMGKLFVIDANDPGQPKVVQTLESYYPFSGEGGSSAGRGYRSVRLVPADGLTDAERVQVAVGLFERSMMLGNNGLYADVSRDFIRFYRFDRIEAGDTARFEVVGFRRPSPLERLLHPWVLKAVVHNDLLYTLQETGNGNALVVYGLDPSGRIKKVGHYRAPGLSRGASAGFEVLEDGRVLLFSPQGAFLVEAPRPRWRAG